MKERTYMPTERLTTVTLWPFIDGNSPASPWSMEWILNSQSGQWGPSQGSLVYLCSCSPSPPPPLCPLCLGYNGPRQITQDSSLRWALSRHHAGPKTSHLFIPCEFLFHGWPVQRAGSSLLFFSLHLLLVIRTNASHSGSFVHACSTLWPCLPNYLLCPALSPASHRIEQT